MHINPRSHAETHADQSTPQGNDGTKALRFVGHARVVWRRLRTGRKRHGEEAWRVDRGRKEFYQVDHVNSRDRQGAGDGFLRSRRPHQEQSRATKRILQHNSLARHWARTGLARTGTNTEEKRGKSTHSLSLALQKHSASAALQIRPRPVRVVSLGQSRREQLCLPPVEVLSATRRSPTPQTTKHSKNKRRPLPPPWGCQTLTLGLTVALLLAELLNVVQVFSPAQAVTVLLLLLLLFSGQQAENAKTPGKTRKYLGFPGYFRVLPALDAGDRRGSLPGLPYSLLLFSRPNVSYCCWGAPLLFCCYC